MNDLQQFLVDQENNEMCTICCVVPINYQIPICQHRICCKNCSITLNKCPICNIPIKLNNHIDNENNGDEKNDNEKSDNEKSDNEKSDNEKIKRRTIRPKCKECNNADLYNDNEKGYVVCTDCGLIDLDTLDVSAEWRFYNSEDSKNVDPSRCGCPSNPYLPKSSLGTMIASSNQNLTRIHQWSSMPYNERSLLHVFDDIKTRCSKYNIPKSVIDDAIFYYKKIHDSKVITRGAIRKGIKASCVLIACQKKKIPMVPRDIAKMFDIKSTDLTRGHKKFYELIGSIDSVTDVENLTSVDYINRFCKKINLNKKYIEIAKEVAKNADKIPTIRENTPPSIAAGTILLTCNHYNLSFCKKQISHGCSISEVTITKTYRKMLQYMDDLIPSEDFINNLNIITNFEDISKVKLYDIHGNN